jgi:hypothetical protein
MSPHLQKKLKLTKHTYRKMLFSISLRDYKISRIIKKINSSPEYRKRYLEDPAGLIEHELGIDLSEDQKKELKQTVKQLFKTSDEITH